MASSSSLPTRNRGSLSTTRPGPAERSVAAAVIIVSAVAFALVVPYARKQFPRIPSIVAAYEGALFICDVVTAVLIGWQATQTRSRALLILTAGYFFDAAMMIPHALSFPEMFAPQGLLGGGAQTTAWLYMFWHGGFPLFVIAYAIADRRAEGREEVPGGLLRPLIVAVAGALLLTVACTLMATLGEPLLPTLIVGDDYRPAIAARVSHVVWALSLMALLSLTPWRPRSVLNLWLGVVMFAWLLDVAASALIGASRYDLGFYAGRLYGLLAATFVLVTLLVEQGRLYARLTAANDVEDRARVLAQVVEAQEHERQRIARELHDEMGTYLTGMTVGLDLLAQKHGAEAVGPLQRLLSQTDEAVDKIAIQLRPPTLDDMGVDRAIGQLVERFTATTGIRVDLHQSIAGERLPESVETTLYRVVQEALTNIGKHSGAQTVSVILERRPEDVQLIVEDNGRGFDASAHAGDTNAHYGLLGMQERIRLLDGTMAVESAPGAGTSLYVRVPVATAGAAT